MYSPKIIEKRLNRLADGIRKSLDPNFAFHDVSVADADDFARHLDAIFDPETGNLARNLTSDEEAFIRHELNRCKADFPYWLTHWARIKNKDAGLVHVIPTYTQELFLNKIAAAELEALSREYGDGVLFAVLKARQMGISTISDCIIAHRCFFYSNITSIIASDVEDHTQNLYEIVARLYDSSPWWLRPRSLDPKRDYRSKNRLLSWADQDSVIRFGSGKNMQGGQDQEKGSLGTGQTPHLIHISEFALWPNAEQVYDSLLPALPRSPRSFAVFESTAKGRGNQWHTTWETAKAGIGRLRPAFFPYYTDPKDYRMPAPTNWVPAPNTIAHAEAVTATSAQWVGHSVTLTRDQMYWYESTFAEYKHLRMLHKFLAEYAYDDLAAFQNTSMGPFVPELIEEMRNAANRRMPIIIEVRPRTELSSHE